MFVLKRSRSRAFLFRREFYLFLLITSTILLGLALYSYNPHDPSWFFYSSQKHEISNQCGAIGAQVAAILIYLFGLASFLILPFLLFMTYLVLQHRKWAKEWERITAFGILIITVAALCTFHTIDYYHSTMPGGYVGYMLNLFLYRLFEQIGTVLLLYTSLQICFVLLFQFSFIRVIQYAVYQCQRLYHFCIERRIIQRIYRFIRTVIIYGMIKPMLLLTRFSLRLLDGSFFEKSSSQDAFSETLPDQEYTVPFVLAESKTENYESNSELMEQVDFIINDKSEEINDIHVSEQLDSDYGLPSLDIFIGVEDKRENTVYRNALEERAHILEEKLERFGVYGSVVSIKSGPVVTLFEYRPQIDTKLSKILALEDDLALALQALSIRILAPIPGRSVVGFEVSNKDRIDVLLARVIKSSEYKNFSGSIPLILGEDTVGNNVIADLAKMPHLLIAGSTGSGKSVALNAMLISMLCKCTPDDLKLILIDPKRLEFAPYNDIAHLLFPIITDPRRAAPVLRWVVQQMEKRYEKMAQYNVRNIFDYNKVALEYGDENFPFIVVVIDELSDLMITVGREIEGLITRITQMARAAGIHMIIATQRPSVDVITGLIKVNFPSRISFRVTSKVDSRTILDCGGANKLLGRGDSLFLDSTTSMLKRIHGAYVSDREIAQVVAHIHKQQDPQYLDINEELKELEEPVSQEDENLFNQVLQFLNVIDEVSISLLQRKFRIGYNRSARVIDMLETRGLIMPADGSKTRRVIR